MATAQNEIDNGELTQQAERALETNTIPALVAAKDRLKEALRNGCPSGSRGSLRRLSKRLTSAMDTCNDAAARELLTQFNTLSAQVRDAVDAKNLPQASAGFKQLMKVTLQITKPKPFMKYAIGRVEAEKGGWEGAVDETMESIGSTQGDFNGLEMEVGKAYQQGAKALASRLQACIETGNTGAALNALLQLREPTNTAGLAAHLGSSERSIAFIADAAAWLKPRQRAHFELKVRRASRQSNHRR